MDIVFFFSIGLKMIIVLEPMHFLAISCFCSPQFNEKIKKYPHSAPSLDIALSWKIHNGRQLRCQERGCEYNGDQLDF